jgi:hypothetical protein
LQRIGAPIGIVLLVAAAVGIVASEVWHGPVILSLSAEHGIDTGDLVAFPLAAIAVALARGRADRRVPGGWAAPASAIVLGILMLLAGVVAKAGGGPLVPSGGGTFDGTIHQTSGTDPVPVDRWSHVAVTYDGATLRLYVDGRQAASRAITGAIQTPSNPVWIGGNLPYGEHFDGLIDEVRIYDRALSQREIRRDMAAPVGPAADLVAGYAFDAGSGTVAADSSGRRNIGEIHGATWVRGRYGDALRFDGEAAVVRVPASTSLDLRRAMTLSAWIRPSAQQTGWRTVVQRQTDAYILTAGSDRQDRYGPIDDVRAALIVAAAMWFFVVIATARGPWTAPRRRSWGMPVALFVVGSLGDAALAPTAALIGPALVALWLAATAPAAPERATFLAAAAVCISLTVGSLADVAWLEATFASNDGAVARTAALGALFAIAGVAQLAAVARATRRSRSSPGSAAGPH